MIDAPLIVLDDDPTGTQAMAGVPVLLRLDEPNLRDAAGLDAPAIHLITNSRAEDPYAAREQLVEVAEAALRVWPDAELILRGDSTLRGHVYEEFDAVRRVRFPSREPVLLLAPALPAAGRVTVDGVHLLEQDGERIPLHDTEYARDPALGYRSARLLDWAEERSDGRLRADRGAHIGLEELRRHGAASVTDHLAGLARRGDTAVCSVDAEHDDDLRLTMAGFAAARAMGVPVVLRCAPTAAGLLSGATADGPADYPATDRVLVVCGSFVPTATRQLAALEQAHPGSVVEADVDALVGEGGDDEVARLVATLDAGLEAGGPTTLATPRTEAQGPGGLDRQRIVAARLAEVVRRLPRPPDVVVTKGGVTSAVTVRDGLGAALAHVVGPVETGVGRWSATAHDGRQVDCLVVPGNVGGDDLLVRLVAGLTRARERPDRG